MKSYFVVIFKNKRIIPCKKILRTGEEGTYRPSVLAVFELLYREIIFSNEILHL